MTGLKAASAALAMVLALASLGAPSLAADTDTFITLGTHGGPVPDPKRSQPANALVVGKAVYLVDAGDGVAEQLAKAGIPLQALKGVFVSHLHFDHTGGLFAILALRHQVDAPGRLKIYGPPGIKETVDGLVAAMQPEALSGYGIPGADFVPPESTAEVVEIRGGTHIDFDGFKLTTVKNTHYSFPPGSDMDRRFESLSFRFELPDRSIVYTGDTGPSEAVTKLASGADLLVSELIDPRFPAAIVPRGTPAQQKGAMVMKEHLTKHHITPEQVGQMAAAAKVGELVVTHLVIGRDPNAPTDQYVTEIHKWYEGPVTIAKDLDRF